MSRVINTESGTTERTRLSKAIVLALRELMRQTEPDDLSKDLAAFVCIALDNIFSSIESSVQAWEKKGYWVKADRFRRDWEWCQSTSNRLRSALLQDDWATVAMCAAQIGQKFSSVKVSERNRIGTPWTGAWRQLTS